MSPPIDIDGSEIQEATIDGQDVSEITIDGQQAAELNVIPDSGVSYYSFNNSNANDQWNDFDGTVNGASYVPSGGYESSGAYDFNAGNGDHIALNGDSAYPIDFTTEGLSVAWRVNPDDLSTARTVWLGDGSQTGWALEILSNGSVQVTVASKGTNPILSSSASAVSTGSLTHIGFSYDASDDNITIYVDGDEDGSGSGGDEDNAQGLNRVGDPGSAGVASGSSFDGVLDDGKYLKRPLTDTEWSDLASTGSIN